MRRKRGVGFLLVLAVLFVGATALANADCKNGAAADYSDVSSVMFERHGCGGFKRTPPQNLKCSGYWVYFGKDFKTTYSQVDEKLGRGGFVLDSSLSDARALLSKYDFYELTPPDISVTDIMYSVLTVRRCNVVTRLMMYPIVQMTAQSKSGNEVLPIGGDQKAADLFAEFDALVERSKKQKVSSHYLWFNLNVFDPGISLPAQCGGRLPDGVVGYVCDKI